MVGLTEVAGKRAGAFSLGMGQRLGIASALLADPQTLILDEPVNGLDPDGVRWIRTLLRGLADEGRTVFLSSHLMSEMALTADHVIVVGQGPAAARPVDGRLHRRGVVATSSGCARRSPTGSPSSSPRPDVTVRSTADETLEVEGRTSEQIGTAAAAAGITLFELATQTASLEEAYMALTEDSLDFRSLRDQPKAAA